MTDNAIDLAAASRVSRRVELREIRLSDISATYKTGLVSKHRLTPTYDHECVPIKAEDGVIEVACSYNFKVRSSDLELAEAHMTYHVIYKLAGDEPIEEKDLEHFARANGAYHSWPFVRETIFSLTAKMGFPPYTLPVLTFFQQKPSAEKPAVVSAPTPAKSETPRD